MSYVALPILSQFNHHGTAELMSVQYNTAMKAILDSHAPIIEKKVRGSPSPPWYNQELHYWDYCKFLIS
jgi:hypothetical protein